MYKCINLPLNMSILYAEEDNWYNNLNNFYFQSKHCHILRQPKYLGISLFSLIFCKSWR